MHQGWNLSANGEMRHYGDLPMKTIKIRAEQKGLTLVEMMIALAIGLVITAVAIQLFLTSQSSLAVQKAMGDMQDSGNFGLEYIARDIRKANLGALSAVADGNMAQGGVILSQNNVTKYLATAAGGTLGEGFDVGYMTRGNETALTTAANSWTGISNMGGNVSSDQLTIQFKAIQTLYSDEEFNAMKNRDTGLSDAEKATVVGYDCSGEKITLQNIADRTYIIQRYFLRRDNDGSDTEPNDPLSLACAAGRYSLQSIEAARTAESSSADKKTFSPVIVTGKLLGQGEIVLRRVDHFHVLLGVSEGGYAAPGNMRYLTVKGYNDLMANTTAVKPQIRSVRLGFVVRAQNSSGKNIDLKDIEKFTVLDQEDLKLKTADTNYLRKVTTQTVAMRNALGEAE
jgi:type IV pilus assembly protein PilW